MAELAGLSGEAAQLNGRAGFVASGESPALPAFDDSSRFGMLTLVNGNPLVVRVPIAPSLRE